MLNNRVCYLIVLFISLLFAGTTVFAQNRSYARTYKVVGLYTRKTLDYRETITNYEFKRVPVTTLERYYLNSDEQEKGLKSSIERWGACSKKINLVNKNGGIVGSKYSCNTRISGRKVSIVGYLYLDSLNKVTYIIAESDKTVEKFARGICPFTFELYNDDGCGEIRD